MHIIILINLKIKLILNKFKLTRMKKTSIKNHEKYPSSHNYTTRLTAKSETIPLQMKFACMCSCVHI